MQTDVRQEDVPAGAPAHHEHDHQLVTATGLEGPVPVTVDARVAYGMATLTDTVGPERECENAMQGPAVSDSDQDREPIRRDRCSRWSVSLPEAGSPRLVRSAVAGRRK
jgi:hypothetical protein